ncbi:hypothetical protein EVAR_28698_1 [Eumeta japonica]|uniref:Uncharacterized protein n=1 Tax=Eumeta variegata TaxID=151549 RepID=A0A4C1V400_EUMVA|nr:hypothetical protein EVAR_28698_1 [Eumeta japonica]
MIQVNLLINVLPSLLTPPSPAFPLSLFPMLHYVLLDEMNKKKRLSKKRARKERHRINSKLNITVSSQLPSLNDVSFLPHLSNVGPIQPSPATPSDTTSPSTKSVGRLEYNNNDIGPFVIHCQRIEASPSAGSVPHPVCFGKIL